MSQLVQQEADWRHCDGTDSNLITFCLAYRLETLFIFDVMTCYDIDYWFSVTQQMIVDWFIFTFWIESEINHTIVGELCLIHPHEASLTM